MESYINFLDKPHVTEEPTTFEQRKEALVQGFEAMRESETNITRQVKMVGFKNFTKQQKTETDLLRFLIKAPEKYFEDLKNNKPKKIFKKKRTEVENLIALWAQLKKDVDFDPIKAENRIEQVSLEAVDRAREEFLKGKRSYI